LYKKHYHRRIIASGAASRCYVLWLKNLRERNNH
jgi:hypothetical protein